MRMKSLSLCILLAVSMPSAALIGINLGAYPDLTPVPGYPVYYAPRADANLFFYDGLYWLYSQDGWYSSTWYNGPWEALAVEAVPLFVLRVPVRYYRQPPVYFRDWREDAPPRWGERWGRDWEQRHHGWEHWDNRHTPRLAPLPVYQRDYDRDRYPQGERQRELRRHHYDYQPREQTARQVYQRPSPAASHRTAGRDRHERDGGRPSSRERVEFRPQERVRMEEGERHERGPRNIERSRNAEQGRDTSSRRTAKLEQQKPPARQARHEPSQPVIAAGTRGCSPSYADRAARRDQAAHNDR